MPNETEAQAKRSARTDRRLMITLTQGQEKQIRAIAEEEVLPIATLLRRWVVKELRRQDALRKEQENPLHP